MTGRTHDLAAFTALTLVVSAYDIPQMSLATGIVALGACLMGGLTPDLDEPAAGFWGRLPAGSIISRIVKPFLGGHRMISHSLLGLLVIGYLVNLLLDKIGAVLLVDMQIVWWAFMIGYVSHLFMDLLTKEGVPLLFPLPFKFGFPPVKAWRITTGKMAEKAIIFPSLLIFAGYIIYQNYGKFLNILDTVTK